jgi:D-alanyl-D-alanine carboxypeptidase
MTSTCQADFAQCCAEFLSKAPNAPGVVARVERGGTVLWSGAAGLARREPAQAMAQDVTFRIASNTKTFTAAAVLRLWEQRRLKLSDPIGLSLPAEVVAKVHTSDEVPLGREITIAQLLQHTSGLPDEPSASYVQRLMADPGRRWLPVEQIEQATRANAPYNRPGEAARYSNTGYIVAALVLETVSGLSLAEAFRTLLRFDELGLQAIYLETLEPVPPGAGPRMTQYFGDYDIARLDASIDLYGGGGLVSDVRDLCGFWAALFEGRVFERPETLRQMCVAMAGTDPDVELGSGLFRRRVKGTTVWFHTGFWGSVALYEPQSGIAIAAATNQTSSHLHEGLFLAFWQRLLELALEA